MLEKAGKEKQEIDKRLVHEARLFDDFRRRGWSPPNVVLAGAGICIGGVKGFSVGWGGIRGTLTLGGIRGR